MHSSPHLRFPLLISVSLLLAAGAARAEDDLFAAVNSADGNRDGFVTRNELLSAYFAKYPGSTSEVRTRFAESVLVKFDGNRDGKISKEEIIAQTPKPGTVLLEKENPENAKLIMTAIAQYRKDHGGFPAQSLYELVKAGLIPAAAAQCCLPNGQKADWGYTPIGQRPLDLDGVLLYSPSPIDSQDHYIIGVGDGRMFVAKGSSLDMTKLPVVKLKKGGLIR